MRILQEYLNGYLRMRRGLGFKLQREGKRLRDFVSFMEQRRATYITRSLALEWATLPRGAQPQYWAQRLVALRPFARYVQNRDRRTEDLPARVISGGGARATPYLYTQQEIQRLMAAAMQLRPRDGLRPWTYCCLLGLLAVTGMRIGEALGLKRQDVDLTEGLLTIHGKFGKARLLPLHPSSRDALARYVRRRDAHPRANKSCAYFLVGEQGRRLSSAAVYYVFYQLSRQTGLRAIGSKTGPRLHDFRHRYALETLLNGYRSGQNAERQLPVLATYLGHGCLEDTYWYLSACPELMQHAVQRLQAQWEKYL
jgi:site-specific recombinase XerD